MQAALNALKVTLVWVAVGLIMSRCRLVDRQIGTALPAQLSPLGWLLSVVGYVGVCYCGATLSRAGIGESTGADWILPTTLETRGIFRIVRNPMSLAGSLLALGIAVSFNSLAALVLALLICAALHYVIVRVGEPRLERRFGAAYVEYKKSVPRWLPRF